MKNHACAIITHGHHTDIALKVYSNRILLIITQFKKPGSLITVNRESSLDQFNSSIFSAKVVFGKDDINVIAAARCIAEQIDINKPLLISLSLKEYSPETVKAIIKAINSIKTW